MFPKEKLKIYYTGMNFEKEINWLLEEKYNGVLTKEAEKDIERLKKGEPVDYLIGFVDFLGVKIDLSFRPLIPREETEYWVSKVLKNIKKGKCLDIFSGSGCIGISLLKNIKDLKVDFVEKNKKMIEQIQINLDKNNISSDRYNLINSDIFENVNEKYNYIFANPPYISENDERLSESVYNFEPHLALFGGKNGLTIIKKFLKEAFSYLKKEGEIYMEFDPFQKDKIEEILRNKNCRFYKDQSNNFRYLKCLYQ